MSAPGAPAQEHFDPRKLVTFTFMVFGMFMAILDIQIVSASLPQIQAGLSASADEATWVQTSYLIAEVIMIPLSGFLSRAISTRYLYTICAGGFTLASLMCSTASDIDEMIFWRAVQGFIGGGMIPTVFASAYTIFPRSKMTIIAPLISVVVTMAPTVGPTVGGYLTDAYSWRWLFLVNLGPGIMVTIAAWTMIDFDHPDLKLLARFDWYGLIFMAGFLGGLEYALEEGPSKNWLQDERVAYAVYVCAASGVAFFARVLTCDHPIVDLAAFRDRNFWSGSLLAFILGIGLYGLVYVYPIYLSVIRGYTPLMVGETMFVTGFCQFLMAPVSGRMMGKVDPRGMIVVGFWFFGLGTWLATEITVEWDFWELMLPQVFRGVGLMLSIVPINNLTLGTIPGPLMKNASGLFNLMRNLGGAFGLALINTAIDKRMDLHLVRLRDSIRWGRDVAEATLAQITAGLAARGSDAALAAVKEVGLMVHRQAMVLALADVFLGLTAIYTLTVGLALLMRRPAHLGGRGG